jgi:glucosamine-6-phosphate deaminase
MKVIIRKSYEDMSAAVADIVLDQLSRKPESLFCFPSGDSPTGMLNILVKRIQQGKADFTKCKFVGLDEWVSMDRNDVGGCKHYMYEKFFDPAGIRKDQITFFDAKAKDLKAECKKVDAVIFDNGGIDLIIVGIGMNGHLGLNEPGSSFENYCHVVDLEESTIKVAQKYFSDSTILKQGITLGLKHITEAKTTIVIAGGEKKSQIIQKIIEGTVTEQVPGSIMQTLNHGLVIVDEGAGSRLSLPA